jgi:hypothetical protein
MSSSCRRRLGFQGFEPYRERLSECGVRWVLVPRPYGLALVALPDWLATVCEASVAVYAACASGQVR